MVKRQPTPDCPNCKDGTKLRIRRGGIGNVFYECKKCGFFKRRSEFQYPVSLTPSTTLDVGLLAGPRYWKGTEAA